MRAKGFQGIVGMVPGVTWGTAVSAGSARGIRVVKLLTPGNQVLGRDPSLAGKATFRPRVKGHRIVDVDLEAVLSYEGYGPIIAFFSGTAGVPSTVDTTARLHVWKPKDDVDGIFQSLAYELMKDVRVVELASVHWTELKLSGNNGSPYIKLQAKGIAYDYIENGASGTNNTTTIDTITYPANADTNVALFSQGVWCMNNQTAGDLASTPLYGIKGWEVTFKRNLQRMVTTRFGDKTDEPLPMGGGDEPALLVSGVWQFGVLENGTGGASSLTTDQLAGTPEKATLTLTGANTAGATTTKYSHKIWFPYIQLLEGKPGIDGMGSPAWDQPWEATHVGTIPTAFTAGYTDAYTWEETSQRATDALA